MATEARIDRLGGVSAARGVGQAARELRAGESSSPGGTANGGVASFRIGYSREPSAPQRVADRQRQEATASAGDAVVSIGQRIASGETGRTTALVYGADGMRAQRAAVEGAGASAIKPAASPPAVSPAPSFSAPAPAGVERNATTVAAPEAAPTAPAPRPATTGSQPAAAPVKAGTPDAPRDGETEVERQRRNLDAQATERTVPAADQNDAARQRIARAYDAVPAAAASVNLFA